MSQSQLTLILRFIISFVAPRSFEQLCSLIMSISSDMELKWLFLELIEKITCYLGRCQERQDTTFERR